MTVADDVAALPGGQPVADAMTTISTADPNSMRGLATRWRQAADQYTGTGAALAGVTDQLHGQWSGAAADAFNKYIGSLNTAGSTMSQALTQVGTAMDQAATAIEGYQNWAATRCEWLLSEARGWLAANPNATPDQQYAAIGALCQETHDDLAKVVDSINTELTTLSGVFGQVADQEQAFNGINPPSGVGIVLTHTVVSFADQKSPAVGTLTAAQPQAGSLIAGQPQAGTAVTPGISGGAFSTPMLRRATTPMSPAVPATLGRRVAAVPASSVLSAAAQIGSAGIPVESGPSGPAPTGQVSDWIQQALSVLAANGVDVSKISPADLYAIIEHESAGNPLAVNNWDANAAAGHPSMGLMQTIDSTFNAYKLPGHDDVWNPVDNIIAGVRYALARYGSISAVPGVAALHEGGAYVGY
jgi:WXG100 family type VII secretion target